MICYFCNERDRESYFSHFCSDCNSLRRLMLSYSPSKCTEILKKTLLRDDQQINYKIQQEIKKIVNKEIITKHEETKEILNDSSYITRSKTKK